jgi:uncharacterized protein (TIGR03086 family)
MARLVEGVPEDALGRPTPCSDWTLGDLLDHIAGSALAFTAAAAKTPLPAGPSGNVANLPADWRTSLPRRLDALAEAWNDPESWTGMTSAGGVDLPGEVAGVVALDELVIHGWDLAKATSQDPGYDGPELEAVHRMVEQFRAGETGEIEGLFGPKVEMDDDAPLLDRIVGLAGRDPEWRPAPSP